LNSGPAAAAAFFGTLRFGTVRPARALIPAPAARGLVPEGGFMAKSDGFGSIFSGNAWMVPALLVGALVMFGLLYVMIEEPAQQQAETPVATEQAPPPAQQ
jgi:hypothetical protein